MKNTEVFRRFIALVIVLAGLGLSGCFANAATPKKLWIVAPGLWNHPQTEKAGHIKMLELYLEKALGEPVNVEFKTAPGFVLSQYHALQKEIVKGAPNWVFYIQRSAFYAYDLEELLLSKTVADQIPSAENVTDDEIRQALPTWLQKVEHPVVFDLKRAVFLKQKLMKGHKTHPYFSNIEDFVLYSSLYLSEQLHRSLEGKTKLIFLVSPERIKYADLIFPQASVSSYLARAYFVDSVIDRAKLKEELSRRVFASELLPREFAELSQAENLVEGSNYVLNSSGVLRSFQILTPVLVEYFRKNGSN